ncbi:MAG: tRNA (N6-threonylcarbamoyladenosine(37)-N6)-methyltransferase TrmO [Chloroflexi bacterium]|nr:tRNA (N6-threonylcarbamoyladenosine(37)-N6)-methyltransferase TrmO [Chloroflexota bacterium]
MDIVLSPIGVVRSTVSALSEMPRRGAPASIEVFPHYVDGLLKIEGNSHIMVIGWLHQSDRSLLRVNRLSTDGFVSRKGVFACRAPVRPNPLGITTARLLKVNGGLLCVDELDMIDGTPVLDIKPHAPGFDAVFSARSVRDIYWAPYRDPVRTRESMVDEAENFHGERCAGLALGVQMMYHAMRTFQVAEKNAGLVVTVGRNGCVADTLQALSGATFGNGRLEVSADPLFRLSYRNRELVFSLKERSGESLEKILTQEVDSLFEIREVRRESGELKPGPEKDDSVPCPVTPSL